MKQKSEEEMKHDFFEEFSREYLDHMQRRADDDTVEVAELMWVAYVTGVRSNG